MGVNLELFTTVMKRLCKLHGNRFIDTEKSNKIIELLGQIEEIWKSMEATPDA